MEDKKTVAVIGAGVVGKRMVDHLIALGVSGFYIGDNNKQNTDLNGIRVNGVDELCKMPLLGYFVSVKKNEEIVRQILNNGVPKDKVFITIDGDSLLAAIHASLFNKGCVLSNSYKHIVFDLSNGDVLGGVEKWSHSMEEYFFRKGYETYSIIPQEKCYSKKQKKRYIVTSGKVFDCEQAIHNLSSEKTILLCNFPAFFFEAAIMLKKYFPQKYRVIAIIHNDEDCYYDMYVRNINYIDCLMYISNRMKEKLIDRGIRYDKLRKLEWSIPQNELTHGEYLNGGVVHIGYAGRITIEQKRVDYILRVIKRLYELKVDFEFEFAGTGDYYEGLVSEIRNLDSENRCKFLGEIPREDIYEFWRDKDIFISTSDWEGRSISKLEAMISGVVPIVTDTSGSADDIENGVNGYIVPLGDWELIVKRICELYADKSKLVSMAENAKRYAEKYVRDFDEDKLWKEILS